ncbi:MAG: phospholipase D-like domain-containing protein [Flavobacterium psychrophilum]
MRSKLQVTIILLLACYSTFFGQIQIHEKGYTLRYYPNHLAIQFLDSLAFQTAVVEDAFSSAPLSFERSSNPLEIKLLQLRPSQILKINYLDNQHQRQSSYIANSSISSGAIEVYFNHTVATAFAQSQAALNLGNLLDDKLITYINECQNDLSIAIYNSYSSSAASGIAGAINAAFDRGVKVRLIYDGSTSSVMIPLLNPLIPILSSPSSSSYGIMHNKFVIFDAESSDPNQPFVWTGSTNWTTSQIDGPDRNNAIVIQDQAFALAYKMEFDEMWGSNSMIPNAVNSKFGPYKADNTPHHFVVGNKVIDSYFSPSDGTNGKIIDAINSAETDLEIATMLITRTDVKNALLGKYNAGLTNINLLVDSQNPTGNQISAIQAGLPQGHAMVFTLSGIMHHKFLVADNFNSNSDPLVLTGSHNWSNSAETKNDENTLIVHDANIANQYFQAFADLYQQAGGNMEFLGVQASSANANLCSIYPNPTSGDCFISWNQIPTDSSTIRVFSAMGMQVLAQKLNPESTNTIRCSMLEAGIYFVSIETAQGKEVFKLIKK